MGCGCRLKITYLRCISLSPLRLCNKSCRIREVYCPACKCCDPRMYVWSNIQNCCFNFLYFCSLTEAETGLTAACVDTECRFHFTPFFKFFWSMLTGKIEENRCSCYLQKRKTDKVYRKQIFRDFFIETYKLLGTSMQPLINLVKISCYYYDCY